MVSAKTLLKDVFGFSEFRPGQRQIIDAVASGENVLAIMPTGGGKSLCFQLPALLNDGLTVVISPLIALMRDQVRGLKAAGVAAGAITSGNTQSKRSVDENRVNKAPTETNVDVKKEKSSNLDNVKISQELDISNLSKTFYSIIE